MKTYIYYFFLIIMGTYGFRLNAQTFHDNTAANSWPNPSPWVSNVLNAPKVGIIDAGALYLVSSNQTVEAGATLQAVGTLQIQGNKTLTNNGTLIIDGIFEIGTGNFINNGTLIVNGNVTGQGSVTLSNTGIVVGSGNFNITVSGNNTNGLTNTGSINGCTGNTCLGGGTLNLGTMPGAPPSGGGLNNIYYTGGAIPTTSCLDRLWITADMNLSQNLTAGAIVVGETLTVNSTYAVTVCQEVTNYGAVILESGASLVQTAATNGNVGDGAYIIKQAGGQTLDTEYNIWSSPISNALTVNDNAGSGTEVFPGTNPCDMYVVDASTQTWAFDFNPALTYTCLTNPNVSFSGYTSADAVADGIMDVGRGYYAVGNGLAKEFVGTVNNGPISIGLYANNLPIPSGWFQANLNLVGNPYPSGLDAVTFLNDNSSLISDGIYFWDDNTNNYVTWNLTGGSAPANTNIGVGQGFWVVASDSGNLNFTNSQRTGVNDQFFKTENTANSNLWLELVTPNGSKGNILVGYSKNATDGMDRLYDAHFMPGNDNVKLVSVINGEEFMIQSVGNLNFKEEKVIALNVRTSETGIHTFSELKRDYIPNSVNVFLRDLETGKMHDLSKGDLSIRLKAEVDYNGRFELVFVNSASQNTDNVVTGNGTESEVTSVEKVVATNGYELLTEGSGYMLRNANGINGSIRVYDVTGKLIWTSSNYSNSTTVRLDLDGLSGGLYILEVLNNQERVYTNKIVK